MTPLEQLLAHCDGKDCYCNALSQRECGCGADWTPAEVYKLRVEVARLNKELAVEEQRTKDAMDAAAEADKRVVPEGWKLVPVEPTDTMLNMACDEYERWGGDACENFTLNDAKCVYDAMLAAAPEYKETDE